MQSLLDMEVVEEVWFLSGSLRLKGELAYPESISPIGAVVLAGPHPMLGGNLGNNVVRGLATGLAQRGVATLSFNYQGFGRSEGEVSNLASQIEEFWVSSHTSEELSYASNYLAAISAIHDMVGNHLPLALMGYSFGCTLLPKAECNSDVPLVLIAPTLGNHDYSAFRSIRNALLVVAPEGDFAADSTLVEQWFQSLTASKQLVRGEWDNHFFRGHEDRLAATVFDFLSVSWRNTCS
jgi:alpha/beta superfamily hydrolase